jgi:putative endonuclease
VGQGEFAGTTPKRALTSRLRALFFTPPLHRNRCIATLPGSSVAEQVTVNHLVAGSIPARAAIRRAVQARLAHGLRPAIPKHCQRNERPCAANGPEQAEQRAARRGTNVSTASRSPVRNAQGPIEPGPLLMACGRQDTLKRKTHRRPAANGPEQAEQRAARRGTNVSTASRSLVRNAQGSLNRAWLAHGLRPAIPKHCQPNECPCAANGPEQAKQRVARRGTTFISRFRVLCTRPTTPGIRSASTTPDAATIWMVADAKIDWFPKIRPRLHVNPLGAEARRLLPGMVAGIPVVYFLRLRSGMLYIGCSCDLEQRLADHASGQACRTTHRDPPTMVLRVEVFTTFSEARCREAQLKRWSRAKKEALIRGRHDELHDLSRSRE